MKGMVGTSFNGSSRRAASKKAIPYMAKARDILAAIDRKLYEPEQNIMWICYRTIESPGDFESIHAQAIWSVWMKLAEAGLLRGIRTSNPSVLLPPDTGGKEQRVVGSPNQEG